MLRNHNLPLQSKSILKNVLTRIDGGTIKLSGFTETLKVKAAEAKLPFPVRHDWDSFFRDSKDMPGLVDAKDMDRESSSDGKDDK